MILTKQRLIQIVREEVNESMSEMRNLSKLIDSGDMEMIKQGIDLASMLNMPIRFGERPPMKLLDYVRAIEDPEILRLLAEDPTSYHTVLSSVAGNRNTPTDVLEKIADDDVEPLYPIRAVNYADYQLRFKRNKERNKPWGER